jgi:hypothetical protein
MPTRERQTTANASRPATLEPASLTRLHRREPGRAPLSTLETTGTGGAPTRRANTARVRRATSAFVGVEWAAWRAQTLANVEQAVGELRRRGWALRVDERRGEQIHPDVDRAIIVNATRLSEGVARRAA